VTTEIRSLAFNSLALLQWRVPMAFNVTWELDESERLSAISLLGKIVLSDGTNSMVEDSIYLDSWILGLVEGSIAVAQGSSAYEIDIIEESRPVRLRTNEAGGLHVSFRDREVIADSVATFSSAVRVAAADFIERTASIEGSGQNEELARIRGLVKKS
jgi:hypothetical protein